jgi:hypothetical protein
MTIQESAVLESALAALEQRAKLNYQRDLDAITHIRRLIAGGATINPESAERLLATATSATPTSAEPNTNADPESQPTLIDAVESIFRNSPDMSLNVSSLEAQLRGRGFVFAAKQPKSSINTAVARLAERGIIRIVKRGTGRKPSTYRLIVQEVHQNNGAIPAEA